MTFNQWIVNEFVPAFSRMLLHSLWIGVVAALLALIIIVFTKKASAAIRYNWLVLLFMITIVVSFFTFFKELKAWPGTNTITSSSNVMPNRSVIIPTYVQDAFDIGERNFLSKVVSFLDLNSTLIVSFWLILFFFNVIKMSLGLRFVQKMKHYKVHPAEPGWTEWIHEKADKLGIKKAVVLLQSELVKMPTAIGYLKPVILIPFGLLLRLSPQEVESILVHELAHIRRRDYLINLFQTFIEAVFFFNPAFLWLSSLIKQEREKCCDDIAVQHSDRKDYLNALMCFQDIHSNTRYAMALGTNKNCLLDRIKRIISSENSRLGKWEMCLLLLAVVLTALSVVAFKPKFKSQERSSLSKGLSKNYYRSSLQSHEKERKNNSVTIDITEGPKRNLVLKGLVSPSGHNSTDATTSATLVKDADKKGTSLELAKKTDTGAVPFKEYRDITITSYPEKGDGYQIIKATDVTGTSYHIETLRNNIQNLLINGKEINSKDYEYYTDLVRHIEFNRMWINQKKFGGNQKQQILKAAEISFEADSKIRKVTKEFKEKSSDFSDSTALLSQLREIQLEAERRRLEILEKN